MPVMLPWYASCAILVKTSLLGLGLLTVLLAIAALIGLRLFGNTLALSTRQRLVRVFKTALYLHLAAYGLLVLKLVYAMFADTSWGDIPSFVLSHLVLHHALSALSATILIVLTIQLYNYRHTHHQLTKQR